MTLTQLGYVLAVADHQNFGAAAAASFVTQPTLSMQIQKLEEQLGVTLFDRSKQPIVPTLIGKQVIAQARLVLNEAQKIPDMVTNNQSEIKGEVRLGVIPTLAPYLLPLFLQRFIEEHGGLKIIIEELQTQQIVDRLKSGDLDLGIAVTPLHNSEVIEHKLLEEPFSLYLSPGHPLLKRRTVTEKDLSPNEIWLLSEGHCFRDQALSLCKDSRREKGALPLRFESGNLETLKKMVDQTAGYTLLPHLAARDLPTKVQRDRLREFVNPKPIREVSLVHYHLFSKTALRDALIAQIKKGLPKDLIGFQKSEVKRVMMPRFD